MADKHTTIDKPKISSDYESRGLDYCHFCGLKYNVGARIPRIIVGCGHTFCTYCLSIFLRNNKIKCPLCRKMLKGVDSVDKLPLNFNILYEIVTQDPLLATVNFDKCLQAEDLSQHEDIQPYLCQKHDQRIKHFYCSEHPSIFCRECIRELHNLEECFVVDLYEIEKMRKLQEGNMQFNRKQIEVRGGACESHVKHPAPPKFENPFMVQDTVKKALFSRKQQKQSTQEKDLGEPSESNESGIDHLNTAEKQKLKREMMMMGYDEDSYDQEQPVGPDGEFAADDDGSQSGLTDEQIFREQKKLFAAQLKQELMYGAPATKKQAVVAAPNDDSYGEEEEEDVDYGDDEYGSSIEDGQVPAHAHHATGAK